jgi:hypothetical protein
MGLPGWREDRRSFGKGQPSSGSRQPLTVPCGEEKVRGIVLFKSQFGTGWVVSGNAEKLLLNEEPPDWKEEASVMLA